MNRIEYSGDPVNISLEAFHSVDHESPLPLYFQLSRLIEKKIEERAWLPGQMLPSEQVFCTKFRMSRTVVRQAFSQLEQKGLVKKRNGKRTMIAFPSYSGALMQDLRGFHEDAVSRGQETHTRVLEFRVIPADREISVALQISQEDSVIMLNRLRFLGKEPEVLVVTYLPFHRCPKLMQEDFTKQSLYEVLDRKHGLRIVKGIRKIRAVALSRHDAKLLRVKSGDPALLLTSIGLLPDGSPLEYFVAKHRGDRSQFEVQLIR